MLEKVTAFLMSGLLALTVAAACGFAADGEAPRKVATPVGQPPSDAIVLFDGSNLDQWVNDNGEAALWTVENGTMTVTEGNLITKQEFGDIQLHVEFKAPSPDEGEGQDKGNSGVYLQKLYEIQVLDNYENETYHDGQCGSIYKQYAPLVNACRPAGEWQSYDIIFHAAELGENGAVLKRATITVLHNGVLVQDNMEANPTGGAAGSPIVERGPILLQDHHHPVSYRNIWIREL